MSHESHESRESESVRATGGQRFHRQTVEALERQGAKLTGFITFVRSLVDRPEYIPTRYINPDAWLVIPAEPVSLVVAFEVDDHSPTGTDRLTRYADTWEALDTSDCRYDLRLVVIDRTGSWGEVDLLAAWYAFGQEKRPEANLSELVFRGGLFRNGWRDEIVKPINLVRHPDLEALVVAMGHVDFRRGVTPKAEAT